MLMKVFNKGQVVIPSRIRRILAIEIGDMVDVDISRVHGKHLVLRKPKQLLSRQLAGSFSSYKEKRPFPSRRQMHEALTKGFLSEE